jgi:CBS domain-containing protein
MTTHTETDPELGALAHATVGDVMHSGIIYCEPDTPLVEVAGLMSANRVHCVAVHATAASGDGTDRVWGIVSDLDLLDAAVHGGLDRSASDVAHTPVITVRSPMPLVTVSEAMVTYGVAHAVAIDPDTAEPIGVLSTLDCAAAIAATAVQSH